MQERVPLSRGRSDKKAPADKKPRKRRKGASAPARKKKSGLPPRFQGPLVPFATRMTVIRPPEAVPGLPMPFSGTSSVDCDLVITVGGKRVPGVSKDEFAESGDASLNEWFRILNGLRWKLRMERKFVCRATQHQLGLVFERNGNRVAFQVRDVFAKTAVPGFEQLVLDRDALLRALRDFVSQTKRLVLKIAPSHAEADSWWHWNAYHSIDADDADDAD